MTGPRGNIRSRVQVIGVKGPAVDPDAFRAEGHCCGILLPLLKELTGDGIQFDLSPETKAELVASGLLTAGVKNERPKTG